MTYVNAATVKARYAPYDKMAAFEEGYRAYMEGRVPAHAIGGVEGQAYDRGAEAAMRVLKMERWVAENVGAN